ncbi:MAG: hypothetical protein K9N46_03210 [Candidatus Marinimicrobia bacterium]|nr:hypothetical protein [Candidatus Neomarinimicrobiota bacterium]MCF7828093.1 hypothetical protein [Candidatus Neomarinimicrobiota bacterium]MCF7879732.1 hypothetical protein [Candidatus Neomarinimicrobiota bacterium]
MESTLTDQQGIQCPICNTTWSTAETEYAWLRDEEMFHCSCGYPLFRKRELQEDELAWIQPAD